MKKFLFLLTLLLLSCNTNQSNDDKYLIDTTSDSIIIESNKSILMSDTLNKLSDSITHEKVVKVITNIKYLTKTVEKLKIEKLNLIKELKYSKENVRIDTVFVETKKSFWGKEKKTITTKTNSQDTESIDSTSTKVLDSIN
jgi:hypothetical protein